MPNDTTELDPEDVRVGATIKALRDAHGLSGAELARLIGVSQQLVSFIESGKRHAGMAICRAVADVLSVKLAAITIEGYAEIADEELADGAQPVKAAS